MSTPALAITSTRSDASRLPWYMEGIRFQLMVLAISFLVVFSRRPDALLNPQFVAEDGSVFFHDAYQLGLNSLLMTYGGYFHTLLRLTALFAQFFPLGYAPLIMNLAGITVQVLPANVFLSSRFSYIPLRIRLLAGLVYIGLPNSFEIHATATNLQWHLALLASLLFLAGPARTLGWRLFDGATLSLGCLTSPMIILLLPVAGLVWWNRRDNWSVASFAFLLPGAAIQAITVLLHWHGRQVPHVNFAGQIVFDSGTIGANFHDFAAILGRQVFFSSLLGVNTQRLLAPSHGQFVVEIICCAIGFAFLLYALRYAPIELRLFILFAYSVLSLALINPLAGTPDHTQWYWLSTPGCGNRYYFLPMLAFLASLFWTASCKTSPSVVRCIALALLLLLPIGIYCDWRLPPLEDFQFVKFVRKFDSVPPGTTVLIPINPGWLMELTRH